MTQQQPNQNNELPNTTSPSILPPPSQKDPSVTSNRFDDDIVVCPSLQHIVYDAQQMEYYNTQTDIFLCEDDIMYHGLRPYSDISCPLPSPLPDNYFKP